MKKFLATVAVIAFSMNAAAAGKSNEGYKTTNELKDAGKSVEKSYKEVPNPARPLAGLLTLPTGRTIFYTGEGIEILGKVGVESAIQNFVSTGACLNETDRAGYDSACVVELPGKLTVTLVNVTGYSAANIVDLAGGLATSPFQIATEASADLSGWLANNNMPISSKVARAFSLVFDKSGQLVGVTVTTFSGGVRELTDGTSMTVSEVINIPASALRGDFKGAGRSAIIGLGRGMCTVVDATVVLGVRLVAGVVGVLSGKSLPVEGCNASFSKDVPAIRNGTYQPKPTDPLGDVYRGGM